MKRASWGSWPAPNELWSRKARGNKMDDRGESRGAKLPRLLLTEVF